MELYKLQSSFTNEQGQTVYYEQYIIQFGDELKFILRKNDKRLLKYVLKPDVLDRLNNGEHIQLGIK